TVPSGISTPAEPPNVHPPAPDRRCISPCTASEIRCRAADAAAVARFRETACALCVALCERQLVSDRHAVAAPAVPVGAIRRTTAPRTAPPPPISPDAAPSAVSVRNPFHVNGSFFWTFVRHRFDTAPPTAPAAIPHPIDPAPAVIAMHPANTTA